MEPSGAHFGFFLIDGFSALAFFSAVEPLRVANRLSGEALYSWSLVTRDGGPGTASNGMRLMADQSLAAFVSAAAPGASLVVVSGFEPEADGVGVHTPALQALSRRGVRLGAIDTGAFLLARAGLIEGGRATVHWEAAAAFREAFADIALSGELFEVGRRTFTCAGGAAALDMMLNAIAADHGRALALQVSEQFLLERMRRPGDHQRLSLAARLGAANRHVLAAVALMEANLETPLALSQVAGRLRITSRQLERLFRQTLGVSPGATYLRLRLDRARQLLRQTEMPVVEVALACGFSSASALSRRYGEAFGLTPRQDRREPDQAF